ncbi:MAG TPA: hypothetical protein DCK98_17525 [Chloroflexi bacterium]|nr:hypothetical protein [Chloroflexota bacterium]HAL26001.1 hypothetical protein [Chloroflexota bacterium]
MATPISSSRPRRSHRRHLRGPPPSRCRSPPRRPLIRSSRRPSRRPRSRPRRGRRPLRSWRQWRPAAPPPSSAPSRS